MHEIRTIQNVDGTGYTYICGFCGHKWGTNEHSSAAEVAALYCPKCAERERQAEKSPMEKLYDDRVTVSENMQRYGGGFASALGVALARADEENFDKIKNNWPELWDKYLNWGK